MSKSEIILKAIGKAMKGCEQLRFIAKIHEGHDYNFMCLGNENIIILSKEFEQVRSIPYATIEGVEVSHKSTKVTVKLTSDSPYVFNIDDKETMMEIFRCSWISDYMFKNAEYTKFPLIFTDEDGAKSRGDPRLEAVRASLKTENNTIVDGEFKGYGFLRDSRFQPVASKPGKYVDEESAATGDPATFTIEVSDELNVQLIPLMGARQELQNFTECYARGIVPREPYWVVWSRPYLKKWNINEDIASWEGWEVFLRTETHDYVVIMLRRKFLPPLLDLFNDIACWYKGPIAKVDDLTKNLHLLQARSIVDTLHSKSKCDDYYSEIVQLKEKALLLGDDEINYIYSVHQPPSGANAIIGDKVVRILRRYRSAKSGQVKESRSRKDSSPEIMRSVKEMCDRSNLPESLRHVWDCKVAHFIATYVDKEEDVSILSLASSIVNIEFTSDDATNIENLLQFALHLRVADQPYESTQPFPTLLLKFTSTLLQDKVPITYLYNTKVMRVMIESGYISKILKLEKLTAYKKFIDCILTNTDDNKLKLSALRQVRDMFKDEFAEKKRADEQSLINYSLWLRPVINLLKSNWSLIVQVALNAIAQMLNTDQIIREQLSTYPEMLENLMMTCRNVRDEDTLEFALLPLYILSDDRSFCETLVRKHDLIPFLFGILKGAGIPGVEHSDDVKIRVVYIMGKTADNYPQVMEEIETKGNIMDITRLVKGSPAVDIVKATSSLMNLLTKRSKKIKQNTGKEFLADLMHILQTNSTNDSLPPEVLMRMVKTMIEYGTNSTENCTLMAESHDILETYLKMHKKLPKTVVALFKRLSNLVLENAHLEPQE